jgi:adenylosuccinate lyase
MIQDAIEEVMFGSILDLTEEIEMFAEQTIDLPLLSLTHGQPATPTTLGKEFYVFVERLNDQVMSLFGFKMHGKFGGAVGNYFAHFSAYPQVEWHTFGKKFVESLDLHARQYSTQINPHDDIAELSHLCVRLNTILIAFSRDVWTYISRGVLTQKVIATETGSSTMPHKVNPIDFENAEGNLGLSSALFTHFAEKLPISRLQRDLSDSTVQRSIGTAFGYQLLAIKSLLKGMSKISPNEQAIDAELKAHPEVYGEAIQTVMRREGIADAYEQLKKFSRGKALTKEQLCEFIDGLPLETKEKKRLKGMIP